MYTQKPGGFGTFVTSSSNFGQSSSGFGGSSFGVQTPLAGGSLFGGGASGTTGSTGGGLFGSVGGTGFGQTQNTGGFSFGANATGNTGGLFGGTSQANTGTSSLFSTPAAGTGFGARPGGFTGFGTSAGQTGSSLFGTNTGATSSLFGQTSATGAFGGASASIAAVGTTVPFNPPNGQDTMMKSGVTTNINTKHQCITAMKEYENKSLEELRMEDYSANRKSKQAGSTSTVGLFGQTPSTQANTGFVFGGGLGSGLQTSTTGFGTFGNTSSAATTPFSQNRPLFGTATTTQSGFGFGTSTATQQSTSLFGSPARPLFGGTASTQPSLTGGSSFFGVSAAGASNPVGFGTSTQSGGLFGAAKPTGFGTATTPSIGFGTGGSLFAKPTSTASTFGFGTNTSTTGFGSTSGGGLFSSIKPTGFGTTTTGLGSGGTFGFGAGLGTGTTTSTFGMPAAKPAFGTGFTFGGGTSGGTAFGSTLGSTNNTIGSLNLGAAGTALGGTAASPAQSNSNQHLLALASSPYGDNPLFWNLKQQNKDRREDALKPTNPNAQKAALLSANRPKVSPRPTTKIKPKSLHSLLSGGKAQLFDGLEDEDFSFGDDTFVPRKSVKKLVLGKGIKNKSIAESNSVYSDTADVTSQLDESYNSNGPAVTPITRPLRTYQHDNNSDNEAEAIVHEQNTPTGRNGAVDQNTSLDDSILGLKRKDLNSNHGDNRLSAADTTSFLGSSDLENSCLPVDRSTPHPTGITLTRPGYYTTPSLDEMIELIDDNGNCLVENLVIGREGFGNIFFPGVTDVTGLNLDEIVHFRRREVVVYPDDKKKPPLGQGLNKKAEITLEYVWPTDKSTRSPIKSPERLKVMNYTDKLEETTAKIGGKFIDYRPETGSWVFQVNHFSKYGLLDDSDEDDLSEQQKELLAGTQSKEVLLVQKLTVQQQNMLAKQKAQLRKGQGSLLKEDQLSLQSDLQQDDQDMMQGEDDDNMLDDDNSLDMSESMNVSLKRRLAGFDDEDSGMDSKYLATTMGISAKNIQGMKASFFGEGLQGFEDFARSKDRRLVGDDADYYDADMRFVWKKSGSKASTGLFGSFKHPAALSLPQSPAFSDRESHEKEGYEPVVLKSGLFDVGSGRDLLRPVPQTFLHPPVMEHKLIPSGMQPNDVPPRIVGTRVRHGILHVKDSLLYRNQQPLLDAACFMGRSFRVGWGPCWTLTHSGNLLGIPEDDTEELSILPSAKGRVKTLPRLKSWMAHVEQIQVSDYMDSQDVDILKQQEDMLKIQLDQSQVSLEEGCPLFVPQPGVEALHQLADCVAQGLAEMNSHPDAGVQLQMKRVLCLCVTLWGKLLQAPDLEKDEVYWEKQLRREAFSQWLSDASLTKVAAEMEACSVINTDSHLKAVFSKLTVKEISQACMLAQRGRDHRLALLLAQAAGNTVTRQMVSMQLDKWAELDAFQFINEVRQKIYSLLGGHLVWCCRDQEINTCQGLDWKRALALHLWYKCPPNSTIQTALHQYQQGFQGTSNSQAYCAAPLPPYLEDQGGSDSDEKIFDTAYHLMCLYADKSYGLEALLSPTSSTSSHLDFRLSWHLLQILQALHYRHLSEYHTDSIHVSFASQLEALGLWHWATFVLLHIQNSFQRHSAVMSLLQRHLGLAHEMTDREQFLIDKLHLPAEWLHQVKAVRARHEGDHDAEASHWILAGHYNTGHTVVIRHIASDAIINENYDYLKSYLDDLSAPERSIGILNWASNGKVFLDFINICRRLEELKQSQPSTYDLEELQPDVRSLCSRIKGLTCHNSKDYLCQAEMSKTLANLSRTFLALDGQSLVKVLSKHIPDLPMPEDYTLQELKALTRAHMLEQCSS